MFEVEAVAPAASQPPSPAIVHTLADSMGVAVRIVREARCLSQRDLSRIMPSSRPYISQVERGQITPGIASVKRMAKALGISPCGLVAIAEALQRVIIP